MQKFLRTLTLMALMLVPWVTQAQTLTVADGTETHRYVPFYGYYADEDQQNQMIYPATDLSAMVGKEITQMVFYYSSVSYGTGVGNWTVSLGETSATSLSGLDNATTLTQVFSGNLDALFDATEQTLTITFDEGYTYNGGNLLVEFSHIADSYRDYYFYGIEATGAAYCYNSVRDFLPKTTFSYESPSSCTKPGVLNVTGTTANSASIAWTAGGSETSWKVYLNDVLQGTVNTPSYTYTGLTLNSDYTFGVSAVCGSDESAQRTLSFHFGYCTPNPTSVDGSGISNVTFGQSPAVNDNLSMSSGNSWFDHSNLIGGSYPGGTINMSIEYATNYSYYTWVWVDWNNDFTFSESEKVYAATSTISSGTLELSFDIPTTAAMGDYRMRIMGKDGPTNNPCYTGSYAYLVDYTLRVGEAPSCMPVTGLAVSYTGGTTATVSWTSDATAWNISINGTVTPITTNPYTITGLNLSTTYTINVQADCGASGTSDWGITPVSFTTPDCWGGHLVEYSLTDSYGDGWEGATITLEDACGNVLETLTTTSSTVNGTLSLCGDYYKFVHHNGTCCGSEHGWTFTEGGATIFSGNGGSYGEGDVLYTVGTNPCPDPTGFAAGGLTINSAELSWTENGTATAWQLCVNGDEDHLINVTANPYTLSGLAENTAYTVKLRANCGEKQSCWTETINFTTLANCQAPVLAAAGITNVTAHTADVAWTGHENDSYDVSYRTAAYFDGESEEFSTTSIPTGWTRYTGLVDNVLNGTATLATTTSGWVFSSAYVFGAYHSKINIYGSNVRSWLVTPETTVGDGYGLSFDLALSDFGNANPIENIGNQADDRFVVLITTDNMATWTILREWNNSGSAYVYDNIATAGENVTIDLAAYAGQNVKVAFYGESTASGGDNDLHIDNVGIGQMVAAGAWQTVNTTATSTNLTGLAGETVYDVKVVAHCGSNVSDESATLQFTTDIACPAPTALTAGIPTPNSVELSWTENGTATAWQLCINGDEGHLVAATSNPFTLDGLTASTAYTVKVRANCGGIDGQSDWSNTVNFTTQANCPSPVFEATGITNVAAHTADVAWTGFTQNDSYVVHYRSQEYIDGMSEEFGTSAPTGWTMYTGLLSNIMNGTALTSATSGWSFGTNNGVFDNHARCNIYSNYQRWLVTSNIEVGSGYGLSFDLALTKYSGTLQPVTAGSQADDKFVVLISTDNMATWNILRQWDNAGSEYVYDNIPCTATGETVNIDLAAYNGQNVNIAFYGESTVSGGDNNLHIDNVAIGQLIPAGAWQTANVASTSTTLTGLTAETPYEVKIEGICGGSPADEMSDLQVFTTLPSCMMVENLAVGEITTNSIALTWSDSYNSGATYIIYMNGAEYATGVTGTSYTVTGLTANTEYSFAVKVDCGSVDGLSDMTAAVSARTACEALALPHTWTFEAEELQSTTQATALPWCSYRKVESVTNPNYPYSYSSTTYAHESSRSLYFYGTTATTYPELMAWIMPAVDVTNFPMNGNRVNFYARSSSTSYNKVVKAYALTDPTDWSTATYVDEVTVIGTTHELYSINLAAAPANAPYLALAVERGSGNLYLDDLTLEEMPSCVEISNLQVTDVTTNSISLAWDDAINPATTGYTVTYTDATGDHSVPVAAGVHVATVTGLEPNTGYTFGVVANCASANSPSTTVTGRTACTAQSLPYAEDFSEYTGFASTSYPYYGPSVMPHCWLYYSNGTNTALTNSTSSYYGGVGVATGTSYGSMVANDKYLYMPVQLTGANVTSSTYLNYETQRGSVKIAAMPLFEQPLSNLRVSFDYKMGTAYSTTGAAAVLELGYISNDDFSTFQPMQSWNAVTTTQSVELTLNELAAAAPAGARLAFRFSGTHNGTGTSSYATVHCGIDNISVEEIPTVLGVTASNVTANSVDLNWDVFRTCTGATYTVTYGTQSTEVSTTNTTISGLTPNTEYTFDVSSSCAAANEPHATVTVTTLQIPATLPYATGFETTDDRDWTMVNGTNGWYFGTAANNGGEQGLYISNNNGAENAYTNSGTGVQWSYAYRLLNISEAGWYNFSFDWKANGESSYDYLRAWLAPSNVSLNAATSPTNTTSANGYINTTPEGWIDLNPNGGKMNLQTTWQSVESLQEIATAGNYNLVLMWVNDNSGGTQPPVAVDNVSVVRNAFEPIDLTAENITSTGATLTWTRDTRNAGAETYTLKKGTETVATGIDANSYVVTLTPNTDNTFTLFAETDGDVSDAENVSIRVNEYPTEAGKMANLAYSYDFTAVAAEPSVSFYYGMGATRTATAAQTLTAATATGATFTNTTSVNWPVDGPVTVVLLNHNANVLNFTPEVTYLCPAVVTNTDPVEETINTGSYTWTTPENHEYTYGPLKGTTLDEQVAALVGTYHDTVLNAGGCDSVYRHLNLTLYPTYEVTLSDEFCQGTTYTVGTGAEAHNYTVSVQEDVHLTAAGGADSLVHVDLHMNAAPVALINNNVNNTINNYCEGFDLTLTATAVEGASAVSGATFEWEDATTAAIRTVNPLSTSTNVYTLTATDPVTGCVSLEPATLTVTTTPVPVLTVTADREAICVGQNSAVLTVTDANNIAGVNFRWYNANTNTVAGTGATLTVNPTETTSYYVVAEGDCEVQSAPITITVNALPVVTVAAAPTVICQNDMIDLTATSVDGYSYSWNTNATTAETSVAATITGNYTVTVTDQNGCVNEFTTNNVTVNPVYELNDAQSVCYLSNPYTWKAGTQTAMNITEDGNYNYTFQTVNGCDSLVHLTFAFEQMSINNTYREVCQNTDVTWGPTTYPSVQESATLTYELGVGDTDPDNNVLDCPAQYNLILTVNPVKATSFDQVACDSYTWNLNGETYTANATPSVTLATTKGCDSTVTMNLTVNYQNTGIDNQVACDRYEWPLNHTIYTASTNEPVFTLTGANAMGCDSVVTLNLTVNYKQENTVFYRECGDTVFVWNEGNGLTYNRNVNPEDNITWNLTTADPTVTTVDGCDSILRLHLVMNYVSDTLNWANVEECDSWFVDTVACDGTIGRKYIDQSGDYQLRTRNAATGRDQISRIHLTINRSEHQTVPETQCVPWTWDVAQGISHEIVSDTVLSQELETASGCRLIKVLRFTAKFPTENVTPITLCQNGSWTDGNSVEYLASNYQLGVNEPVVWNTTTNAAGCDSVDKVVFTVNPVYNVTAVETYCESEFDDGPIVYANPNNAAETVELTIPGALNQVAYNNSVIANWTTAQGCDSIVTINYTVNPSVTEDVTVQNCYTYTWNGRDYNTLGDTEDKFDTVSTLTGCDSTAILHLTLTDTVIGVVTIEACGEYTYNNVTYRESKTFIEESGMALSGCDSVTHFVYNLTPRVMKDVYVVANAPYTWENGQTYTTNKDGIFYDATLPGACDSILVLHLTMEQPIVICENELPYTTTFGVTLTDDTTNYTETINGVLYDIDYTVNHNTVETVTVDNACNSYEWHGVTYTESGNYTFDTVNANGCDSTATLALTVNVSTDSVLTAVACDTYTWSGITFTASADTTIVGLTNAKGCDSTATLHLTINVNPGVEETVAICNSYVWNNQTLTASGDYNVTFQDANGCTADSVLHLTINTPTENNLVIIDTAASTYYNGTYYADINEANGGLPYTFDVLYEGANVNGCDSTDHVTLYVTRGTVTDENYNKCGEFTWDRNNHTYAWIDVAERQANGNALYKDITDATAPVYIHTGENPIAVVADAMGVPTQTYVLWLNMIEANYFDYDLGTILLSQQNSVTVNPGDTLDAQTIDLSEFVAAKQNATLNVTLHHTSTYYCENVVTYTANLMWNYDTLDNVYVCNGQATYDWTEGDETFVETLTGDETTFTEIFAAGTANEMVKTVTVVRMPAIVPVDTAAVACDEFTWYGTTYTETPAVAPTHLFQVEHNGVLCDSTVTLNLTVNYSTSSVNEVTVCGTYTWEEKIVAGAAKVYTESNNTDTIMLTNNAGCDSIVTLNLTIYPVYADTVMAVACDSYTWTVNTFNPATGLYDNVVVGTYTESSNNDEVEYVPTQNIDVVIGDSAATTGNSYLPAYSLYEYSLTQQIYTADEIGTSGDINSLTMWLQNTSSYARNWQIYMKEVDKSTFASGSDWVSLTDADLVASGTIPNGISSFVAKTFEFNTPFSYTGTGNLLVCVRDMTGDWSSGCYANNMAGNGSQAMYAYRDGTVYNPTTPGVNGTLLGVKNVIGLNITTGGGGAFMYNAKNQYGCDSLLTLNLTINNHVDTGVYDTACVSYTWVANNNAEYTASGDYTRDITDANGCAATETLHLTINTPELFTRDQYVFGNGITINGHFYEAAATGVAHYTVVLDTVDGNGCATTVTVELYVSQYEYVYTNHVGCGSYTWTVADNGDDKVYRTMTATEAAANPTALYWNETDNAPVLEMPRHSDGNMIYVLNLTLNEPSVTEINVTALASQLGTGNVYSTVDGDIDCSAAVAAKATTVITEEFSMGPHAACDSIVRYNINVVYNYDTLAPVTYCENITTYTDSNNVEHNITVGDNPIDFTVNAGTDNEMNHHVVVTVNAHTPSTPQVVTACDTYTWENGDGQTYTVSGTYNWNDDENCTAETLQLTINNHIDAELNVTVCDTYTWVDNDNAVYTTSGDYTRDITDVNECAATETLHLTINTNAGVEETVAACDSYSWTYAAEPLTESNTYTETFTDGNGCEGTATLHLTINTNAGIKDTVASCYTYTWTYQSFNAVSNQMEDVSYTYTESGDKTETYVDANGCVGTATLNLTINGSESIDTAFWFGDGSYRYTGIFTTATGHMYTPGDYTGITETVAGVTANGCDSIYNITLHVGNNYTHTDAVRSCATYTWNRNNTTYARLTDAQVAQYPTAIYFDQTNNEPVYYNPVVVEPRVNDYADEYMLDLTLDAITERDTTIIFPVSMGILTYAGQNYNYTISNDEGREFTDTTYEYEIHLNAVQACDSIINLTVNVVNNYVFDSTIDLCYSVANYTWEGQTLTLDANPDVANTYYMYSANDADTTVHWIKLNQHPIQYVTERRTECESYTWNGRLFTESTSGATMNLTDQYGCDSTVTLVLTINHATNQTLGTEDAPVEACDSYTWTLGDGTELPEKIEQSGTYTWDYTTAEGCESHDTLYLLVNLSTHTEEEVTACDSYTWDAPDGNTYVMVASEEKLVNYNNAAGCASTAKMTLTINQSSSDAVVESACDSFSWALNGETYTESGIYTDTIANAVGCDSIITLTLTIDQSNGRTEVTACDSYTWTLNGVTYTESGAYEHISDVANTCGSLTDSLFLTINKNSGHLEEVAICSSNLPAGGYIWNGNAYTVDGEYYYDYTDDNNCLSQDTLKLTIGNVRSYGRVYVENCGPYTWDVTGETFTESTEASTIMAGANAVGCDSVLMLYLTIYEQPVVNDTAVVCNNEPYIWHGQTYETTGEYTVTAPYDEHCDSLYVLNLTVNEISYSTTDVTACDSYEWNGETYTENGVYTYNTTNAAGCDSVATLNLTINVNSGHVVSEAVCDSYEWHGVTYTESGEYYYNYNDGNNCASEDTLLLTVANSENNTVNEIACDSYTWTAGDGETYTESGTYVYNYTTGDNCTGVKTLVLTVNSSNSSEEIVEACDSYDWNGETYSESGVYTYTTTNVAGCDSVVTLTLKMHESTEGEESIAACNYYTWNGTTYTESGDYTYNTTNAAGCDSTATLHLTVNSSDAVTVNEEACDSYTWNGAIYTQSGDYTYAGTNAAGCDSVVTLHLTIKNSANDAVQATACNSYVWTEGDGQTYTESGVYTYTTNAANGCDSVVTLTLTINTPANTTETVEACDSYTWNNQTYTTSGVYTNNFVDVNGCDAMATLNLTVKASSSSSEIVTTCGAYDWNGQTYTQTGVYTFQTTNAAGCDSTAILSLVINQSVSSSETATACDSYEWNGTTYTESGVYTFNSTTIEGCDSIATLLLTIKNSTNNAETVTACDSYTWNNTEYVQSGDYTYNYTNAAGCASVDTLHLTVNTSTHNAETATACESYLWHGETYVTSGDKYYSYTNAAGCASVDTLHLTINQPVTNTITATACGSYVWGNTTYLNSDSYQQTFTAANGCDSVVTLILTINQPMNTTESAEACGSYTWNGQTYTTSGTKTYAFTDVHGCEATATLNLTINNPVNSSVNATACDSYTWNGQTYTTSGDYTYTTTAANGCDSVVTLHLTINSATTENVYAEACSAYNWNGQTYTTSGVYTYQTTNANGCDSTVTLLLNISQAAVVTINQTACDSYTWTGATGATYTTSGEYTYTTSTVSGCDSTITLNLTINNSASNSINETACNSYNWNGQTYTTSGIYSQSFIGANGCDSIVNLTLTINTPVEVTINETACSSYEWNGTEYTTSGNYTYTTTAANGCDSITTLNLTINQPVYVTLDASAEGSYSWNGTVYTESGVYTYTTNAANGCDSVTTLNLTVTPVYTVTLISANSEMGTVSESGTIAENGYFTATATANEGYEFVGWMNGNETVSTSAVYVFQVTEDITLTAVFQEKVGISDVDMDNVTIYSTDTRIFVRGAEGYDVYVYDVNGRMMDRQLNAPEAIEFRMTATGVYLVKVGNAPAKRVVVVR